MRSVIRQCYTEVLCGVLYGSNIRSVIRFFYPDRLRSSAMPDHVAIKKKTCVSLLFVFIYFHTIPLD